MRWGRIVLVTVAALTCVALLTACSPSKEQVAADQRDKCFANQLKIKVAIDAVHADTGVYPDLNDVIKQLDAKCPGGGTYSYDAGTGAISCSVHGARPADQ
jgi:hypothetical protein